MAAFSAVPWTMAQTIRADSDHTASNQTRQGQPKALMFRMHPQQAPADLPTQDDSQIKHDGTKTDVDAVGNRNVGCGRGVGNWYTDRAASGAGPRLCAADRIAGQAGQ